ncbi:MAG TPA: glycosyl hydrolase family 28-related protein [Acidimicrobiales bacterium]|nr:glycosyl hydrolase family 28-related protein [Acidimicrobiales bacterium]
MAMAVVASLIGVTAPGSTAQAGAAPLTTPALGPNVYIFSPSTPQSQIQATVDSIAAQQVSNEFGPQRYALLFEPGTYGSAAQPLNFRVGYYTEVAGLGISPTDVTINGSIDVYNQCASQNSCVALNNFWRSLSNLTINVTTPNAGCYSGEFWAVSQAAPMRRVNVLGNTTLMDYCTAPSYASGGFIADSAFSGGSVINGSQQQFVVRNSSIDHWTNGVWNQVFSGDIGAPPQCFPAQPACGGPYTTLPASPVTEEKPFIFTDAAGAFNVFVPAVQHNSVGPSWNSTGGTPGRSVPLSQFFIADPATSVAAINAALARGEDLLLTPGVYNLDRTIEVRRPDTVVLGIGFPTLVPQNGQVTMSVANVAGVRLAGMIFDAGPVNSPVLLQVGRCPGSPQAAGTGGPCAVGGAARRSDPADPTAIEDVFFRIGGATPGRATDSLVVDSSNVILDDVWAWRADHGNGVGWTSNTADTGVVVNGDNVTAYGLFVEHYQKYEVIWNGQNGTVVFFQNEMPYDPPSQAAWMATPTEKGYPALLVSPNVSSFHGYGMGSYSFFNQGVVNYADRAFQVPDTLPAGSLRDLLTVFLDPSRGKGGILHVVNNTGGSSTAANPSVPVTVTSYP